MGVRDSAGQPEDSKAEAPAPAGRRDGEVAAGWSPRPDAGRWNERLGPPVEPSRGDAFAFFAYSVLGPAGPVLGVPTWSPTPTVPFPRPAPNPETDPPGLG